jgi:hypothetical protein
MSRADRITGATLFVAALVLGTWYVPQVVAAGGKPHFYQEQFGPAVMVACGQGYVNPKPGANADLDALLALQREDFQCTPGLAGIERLPLSAMQRAYRYLITAVGWTWRLQSRVGWLAVAPLYGMFFAATVVLLFAVFRQGMGVVLAGTITVVLAVSPLHVMYLAHLRDYSKAPFILALVLLAARLVKRPLTFRHAALLAGGAGLLNGFAMGFRNDLLVAVPAFVGLLLVFLDHSRFSRGWRNLALAVVYLAGFLAALTPMASIYRSGGGNSSQHLIVLGLGEPFNQELGVDSGGTYEWGYGYRDEFAHAMIAANATRRMGSTKFLPIYGPDYDRSGADLLSQVIDHFPADMLTRAYASAIRVLELPYNQRLMLPHVEYLRLPHEVFVVRDRFQRAMAPYWLAIVGVALCLLSIISIRIGIFVILLVLYLGAYPALQFGERHYFHLEFISWWALGFVASAAATALHESTKVGLGQWLNRVRPAAGWPKASARAAVLFVVAALLLLTPLTMLRRFQQNHLGTLFAQYASAPVEAPALVPVPLGNGYVRFEAPMGATSAQAVAADDAVHAEVFMAEFGGATCDSLKLDAVFRYDASEPQYDFTRALVVQPPLSSTPLRVWFPAYFHRARQSEAERMQTGLAQYGLAGLEIPESAQSCLTRFARIADASQLPMLFELRLRPGWENSDRFQTIEGIESRRNGEEVPSVYTFPADLVVGRNLLMTPIEPLNAASIAKRSPTLNTSQPQWINQGVGGVGGKGPFLYLFEMQPEQVTEGRLALVQGYIRKGGVSFGLVSNGQWVAQAGVTRPGEFTIVVRVPTTGAHSLVLANNLIGSSLENDLIVRRVGWIPQSR